MDPINSSTGWTREAWTIIVAHALSTYTPNSSDGIPRQLDVTVSESCLGSTQRGQTEWSDTILHD